MAKYTTNFLTWLKGLFHTKTEVDNLLETKINTVDVQGKITSFTNKDRINIERLINYMENGSGSNYYTLTLKAGAYAGWSEDNYNNSTTGNLGVNNASANTSPSVCCFAVDIKKNGTIQKNSSIPVVLKNTDGTKIFDFVADNFSWTSVRKESVQVRNVFGSTPGIHYVYAEATISGSVYKSNIIGVFVKDTNNLLSHNQWTAGEYGNTIPVILANMLGVITNNYSDIGEQSLKLTKNAPSGSYSRITYNQSIINKTVTVSAHIRTVDTNAKLLLLELDSNSSTIQSRTVNIPSNSYGTFNTSLISGSNNSKFVIQFSNIGGQGSDIYVDDIIFTVS